MPSPNPTLIDATLIDEDESRRRVQLPAKPVPPTWVFENASVGTTPPFSERLYCRLSGMEYRQMEQRAAPDRLVCHVSSPDGKPHGGERFYAATKDGAHYCLLHWDVLGSAPPDVEAAWTCEYPKATDQAPCGAPAVRVVMGRTAGVIPLFAAVCDQHLEGGVADLKQLRREVTHRPLHTS